MTVSIISRWDFILDMTLHTASWPLSFGSGRQVGSSCTPLRPSPWRVPVTGGGSGVREAYPGCDWSAVG